MVLIICHVHPPVTLLLSIETPPWFLIPSGIKFRQFYGTRLFTMNSQFFPLPFLYVMLQEPRSTLSSLFITWFLSLFMLSWSTLLLFCLTPTNCWRLNSSVNSKKFMHTAEVVRCFCYSLSKTSHIYEWTYHCALKLYSYILCRDSTWFLNTCFCKSGPITTENGWGNLS